MITSKIFHSKNFFILGMGVTGETLANALHKSGANIFFWDDDILIRRKFKKKKYRIYKKGFFISDSIDFFVVSPGINVNNNKVKKFIKLAKNYKCQIVSELDLFQIYLDNSKYSDKVKTIAVTGTNGKSTLVSLLHHVFKKNKITSSLIGNIGNSIFSSKELKEGFYIIEASSYQLDNSNTFSPDIACVLNLSPDHLERHGSMKKYAVAKLKIFQNLKCYQYGIINDNHNELKNEKNKFSNSIKKRIISIDFKKGKYSYLSKKRNKLIKKRIINRRVPNEYLSREHNKKNVYFLIRIIAILNIRYSQIVGSLKIFSGLQHRQEVVFSNRELLVINDSKATNFESVIPALRNYKNIHLICGGISKSKNITILNSHKDQLLKVYIIGSYKEPFLSYFKTNVKTVYVKYLSKAIHMISSEIKNDESFKTVLLSPGAASFDQFQNFEDRGNHFKKLINLYIKSVRN